MASLYNTRRITIIKSYSFSIISLKIPSYNLATEFIVMLIKNDLDLYFYIYTMLLDILPNIGKYSIQKKYTQFKDFVIIDKIDWRILSSNRYAIHYLEANQDKIDWNNLSLNPNAIHLLEQNQDKETGYFYIKSKCNL